MMHLHSISEESETGQIACTNILKISRPYLVENPDHNQFKGNLKTFYLHARNDQVLLNRSHSGPTMVPR